MGKELDLAAQRAWALDASQAQIVPSSYRGRPADILIAVGLGAGMGLSPAESLYRIHVIEGKPTASAELIGANVRRAGHRLRVRGDSDSATAEIIRADDPEYTFTVTWTMDMARAAGLSNRGPWKQYPSAMLRARAITDVARMACPDALYGVIYTAEEMDHSEAAPAGRVDAPQGAPGTDTGAEAVVDAEVVDDAVQRAPAAKVAEMRDVVQALGLSPEQAKAMLADVTGRAGARSDNLTDDEVDAVLVHLYESQPDAEVVDADDVWARDVAEGGDK